MADRQPELDPPITWQSVLSILVLTLVVALVAMQPCTARQRCVGQGGQVVTECAKVGSAKLCFWRCIEGRELDVAPR